MEGLRFESSVHRLAIATARTTVHCALNNEQTQATHGQTSRNASKHIGHFAFAFATAALAFTCGSGRGGCRIARLDDKDRWQGDDLYRRSSGTRCHHIDPARHLVPMDTAAVCV